LAIGVPLALLLGVGAILWIQVTQMRELAQWVDHTDQVIAHIYEVQRDIANQEAAVRGYLLLEDRALLGRPEPSEATRRYAEWLLAPTNQLLAARPR
jgi:CHASE3 domain sensor protein